MKPIINPLWFYLIGISENIACTFWIVGGIILAIVVIAGILIACDEYVNEAEKIKDFFKVGKKAIIIGILLITIGNLIPSKSTCYQMMTAGLVTPNNITAVGDAATDVVDYIIESVDTLLDAEDEESN